MISREILEKLSEETDEEKRILGGSGSIEKNLYTGYSEFVIDSARLLEKGKLIEIRPHTRFVRFPSHRHNYIEMIYMCSGSTTHIINGNTVKLGAGEILILSQNCSQEVLPAGRGDIAINFIILPEFFASNSTFPAEESVVGDFLVNCLTNANSFSKYLHYHVSELLPVQNLVENMIYSSINPQPFGRRILESTMSLLFLHLMNYTNTIRGSRDEYEKKLILKSLSYIEKNYKSASLTRLSQMLNQNIFIMSRLIKEYTGKTYNELLKTKRLNQAAYLLTHSRLDIASIASEVGYDNRSYFYRIFKEKFDLTPKQYREKYKI